MAGIGNGFSSGIQSLNENFFVHTGRSCPTSWKELKDNLSKNMKTCAKVCTAFLDSSFGLALAMGVVGIVTTSLCAGEDMINVVAIALPPLSNSELVYLCVPGQQDILGQGKSGEKNWTLGQFGIGQLSANEISDYDMNCFSLQEYHKQYPNTSVLECQATDWSGYPNYNATQRYLTYVYMENKGKNESLITSNLMDCIMKDVFDMLGKSNPSLLEQASVAMYKPPSIQNVTGNDRTNAHDGVDRGAYCWTIMHNIRKQFPQYFFDTNNCTMSQKATAAPLTTSITTPATFTPLITEMPDIDNGSSPCTKMLLAFGQGSALILTAILAKMVYKKYRKPKRINTKVSTDKSGNFLILGMQEWLLLGASEVGCGVFFSSVKDVCGPASKETKQMLAISIALYLTSAATRLLGTCITSPIEEDADHEEDVEVGLPMLVAAVPGVGGSLSSCSNDPEEPV
ncbi:hypothetical protein CLAVI_001032 [Candidatus Clavichlamydia salmonicola]|uniref:hypothetical protein n=1 Tax=Candidatus Clavichlamydia salmonicola TaxID=469812 RepID=UPI00189149B9|nr:hypothetical protein [Candidatus Clavichlamydia salmonicola]MBF5051388.1 hypothetical protein [Candidatus Clavichlamydia salmonicola]